MPDKLLPDGINQETAAADKPRLLNLRTILLLLLTGCVMAGNGLVVPMLTIYGQQFSASAALVGMMITIFGIGRMAISLPTGLLARRIGSRSLLVAGNALLMLGAVGAALAHDLPLLLFARLIQGIGSGIYLTAAGIVIAETSRPETRGRFMALYQGAIYTGAGIGPAIGGFLAQGFGITAPFWAYALLSLVAMLVALWFPAPHASTRSPEQRPPLLSLLRNLPLVAVFLLSFATGFTRTAAHWQMVPLLGSTRLNMGFDDIGLVLTVNAFMNVGVLPLSGWLIDRFGARRVTPLAALSFAASLLLIAFDGGLVGFWVGMVLLGITGGFVSPTIGASLVEVAPRALLGPAVGTQRSIGDLGFLLGPILIGTLLDVTGVGPATGLLAIAVVVTGAAGLCWYAVRRQQPGNS